MEHSEQALDLVFERVVAAKNTLQVLIKTEEKLKKKILHREGVETMKKTIKILEFIIENLQQTKDETLIDKINKIIN
jgi:alkylated DNA nucleotide flippase Atl1